MADKLTKLVKVFENFTVNRYDNGWMVEVSGRDKNSDNKTMKIVCNTEDEVLTLVKEYNRTELET